MVAYDVVAIRAEIKRCYKVHQRRATDRRADAARREVARRVNATPVAMRAGGECCERARLAEGRSHCFFHDVFTWL